MSNWKKLEGALAAPRPICLFAAAALGAEQSQELVAPQAVTA